MFTHTNNNPYNDYHHPNNPNSHNHPQNHNTNNHSYYHIHPPNKSKKEFGMFSKRYLPKDSSAIQNRSRMSQNMSSSNMEQMPE